MTTLVLHERTQILFDKLKGNLPHALVIEGPIGVGVTAIAKELSKSVDSPMLIIEPKKSVNGQMVVDPKEGNIIIDDIRQLYEQTRTTLPGSLVYILDTGERSMTTAAQNAFLKLLEEPRNGLYFIITTHQPDQLLPTIASRSQRLTVLPVTDTQTQQIISDLNITDPAKKARLSFVGRGLPALIHRLAQDEKSYEARVEIMTDAKTMISGTPYEKLHVSQKYKDNRASAAMLVDDMNHQLKVVALKTPSAQIVATIDRNLDARERIVAGGNIRLQLAKTVL